MSRALIRSLVVLSVIAIVGILTVQAVWLRRAYALGERQFRQTAFVALQEVADQVAKLNRIRQTQAAVVQLSADYFVVRTDAPINPVLLEHYLQTALRRHRLLTDFEYGIYNCETERMVYGAYVSSVTQTTVNNALPGRQQPPRFPGYTHYFEIRFPGQAGFVTGQLNGWLASSVAVALVVVLFGYTLWVVLRQRQLADIQREFINNVTHELQTPVSTLRIAAGVLQQPGISQQPERLGQYARVVAEESGRLQRQVQAVLNLARRQHTGFATDRVVLDLNQLLTDVAQAHTVPIRLDLQAAPAWLLADAYALETLLNNLIDNARTYCTDQPDILLSSRTVGQRLIWSVADKGVGIAKAHQRAVFRQFYRVPTGNVPTGKGFGLGLYYVSRVARAHGWQLRLDSTPGLGSTFTFTAPLASFVPQPAVAEPVC
ncbi:two-component system sensor histidine kinase [Fibrella aestuarina BUZ 2]|uniref:histidine kinase n=1 Tax=Fibrella aestuarina BUZ 2 TaxID=1166018 RepID=I0K5Q8_9BACT|nr:HAMP domain-containing sensor histidine kinase [Fibrella aestuarina]CCG99461.1 two-component system sensor histidine kinase [Fibrella aestuarina BUZ 2]